MHFFVVEHNDHHGRLRLHLLLKIEIFGIGLLWRCGLACAIGALRSAFTPLTESGSRMAGTVAGWRWVGMVHERTNQLAITESFPLKVTLNGYGWNCILHGTT